METLLCDDAANLYIEDMACEVALRSDFAGYRFYPLYVQDMAKIYKVVDIPLRLAGYRWEVTLFQAGKRKTLIRLSNLPEKR